MEKKDRVIEGSCVYFCVCMCVYVCVCLGEFVCVCVYWMNTAGWGGGHTRH